jgi:NAD(P)-dependent dehydrogenase (short-subunit alcohol dehydrogenase family)
MNDLSGKTALVSGATSGLGRVTARVLASHGASVVVHGRDPQRGARTVDEIAAAGGRARFVAADLLEPDEIRRLAEDSGDIDILVNNAGAYWFGSTPAMDVTDLDLMLRSNIRSAFLLTAALGPAMAARGHGSIVNVSSLAARIGLTAAAGYGATKAAMEALTRAWAAEFSPSGVRVNAVVPGPIQPETGSDPLVDSIAETTLLRRPAAAEEIAAAIAFLAGPAASYITGAALPVDGGRTAI